MHSPILLFFFLTVWWKDITAAPPVTGQDFYPDLRDAVERLEEEYRPDLVSSGDGYGDRPVRCHDEEQVSFVDKCEAYQEETCYTQNEEICETEKFKNCTGVIETKAERQCFDVNELVCGLLEKIDYFTLQEDYQVQVCSVVKERICDTTFNIDMNTRDDFQCCNLEYEQCEDAEAVLMDVTCKKTVEFQCRKEKRTEGGYGKETICDKVPRENCYDTPRTVRQEICRPMNRRYCQKFTNPFPQPVEKQNCHFEPKKICELQTKSRPRKAKRYSYTQNCTPVPRQICDTVQTKKVVPACEMMDRIKCDYVPKKSCSTEDKQYCWKQEVVTIKQVCDKKFSFESL